MKVRERWQIAGNWRQSELRICSAWRKFNVLYLVPPSPTLRVSIPFSLRKLYSCTHTPHPAPVQQHQWHVLAAADHHICSNRGLASLQHSASAPGHASSCRMHRLAGVSAFVRAHVSVHRRLVSHTIECHQPFPLSNGTYVARCFIISLERPLHSRPNLATF